MIASCNLKCSYRSFEYFLLHIGSKNDFTYVESKLLNLKKLDCSSNHIVLSFDSALELDDITELVKNISELAYKNSLVIHSIVKHKNIITDKINNISVIDLPETSTNQSLQDINKTLTFSEPVRSGIQVKNDGDIIITNFVSNNAEVIATGNIHVYGEARGRLIAGSNGDKQAKIFVTKFNPELISIGGIFKALENKLPDSILNQPVMVTLDDKNHLNITQML